MHAGLIFIDPYETIWNVPQSQSNTSSKHHSTSLYHHSLSHYPLLMMVSWWFNINDRFSLIISMNASWKTIIKPHKTIIKPHKTGKSHDFFTFSIFFSRLRGMAPLPYPRIRSRCWKPWGRAAQRFFGTAGGIVPTPEMGKVWENCDSYGMLLWKLRKKWSFMIRKNVVFCAFIRIFYGVIIG